MQEALSIHAHYASSPRTVFHRAWPTVRPPQPSPPATTVENADHPSPVDISGGDASPTDGVSTSNEATPDGDAALANNSSKSQHGGPESSGFNLGSDRNKTSVSTVGHLERKAAISKNNVQTKQEVDEDSIRNNPELAGGDKVVHPRSGDEVGEGNGDLDSVEAKLGDGDRCEELAWLLAIGVMMLDLIRPLPLRYDDCDPILKNFLFCLRCVKGVFISVIEL